MIELDAWEIEDIRAELRTVVANNVGIDGSDAGADCNLVIDHIEDYEVLAVADRIVSIHEMHVARAIRSSMVAGLKRIENRGIIYLTSEE